MRALYIKDPKRDFTRKIREAKLASELEDKHSKTWVLHNYLNSVPYGTVGGRTAIGVEAAAVTFFNKHARRLRLYQAALLAGLPQAPSEYNPFRNPQAALERRNEVLRQMLKNGYITQAEFDRASQRGLGLRHGTRYIQRREPYFFDYVQDKLIERYGVGVVRRGGLRIHTTIDPALQDEARAAIASMWADPAGPSSALVAIDPANGKIRAMASSSSYTHSNFNLAAQGHRQPGSAFKTFVLTAAIRKGINPDTTYYTSKPLDIPLPGTTPWEVKTFGNTYLGTVSLTRATLSSDNTVYAQLILDVGPKAVCETAKLLGITTKLDCYPAEGLGGLTRGVTPLEMADAYATLASGGIRHRPTGIERGRLPRRQEREPRQVRGQARADRRRGIRGHQGAQEERAGRHRGRRELRLPGRRQDGHDGRGEGRLVRGLHAEGVGGGMGRLPGRRHRDAGRAGRDLRGAGVAQLHAARARRLLRRLPAADRAGAVLTLLRQVLGHRQVRARSSTTTPRTPPRARSTTRATTSRRRSTSRTRRRRSRWRPRRPPRPGTAMGTGTTAARRPTEPRPAR